MNAIERYRKRRENRIFKRIIHADSREERERLTYVLYVNGTRTDGGEGSGNFNHAGVIGQQGGSAPTVGGLNDSLREAYDDEYDTGNAVEWAVSDTLSSLPVGSTFNAGGYLFGVMDTDDDSPYLRTDTGELMTEDEIVQLAKKGIDYYSKEMKVLTVATPDDTETATAMLKAATMNSGEVDSYLKDNFDKLEPQEKLGVLDNFGVIPDSEYFEIELALKNDDFSEYTPEDAEAMLKDYAEQYFQDVENSREPRTLEYEKRDALEAMNDGEKREWISNSTSRFLTEDEENWANNTELQRVVIDLGVDGTPQVMGQKDFQAYVAENNVPVFYRGVKDNDDMQVSSDNIKYQIMYGNDYTGEGIYGDGLYFSTAVYTARHYGESEPLKACLRADAKVVDYNNDLKDYHEQLNASNDISITALSMGYDAIRVKQGGDESYYVILNREAMIVQDKNETNERFTVQKIEENS